MINNVTLVGRLTADPELKYTNSGTAVMSFRVAADRPFKNNQGERDTDFINCQAWRKTAEIIGQYGHKGMLVGVTGRIQTRQYENNEGRTVFVTEVVAENFQMLESKKERQHASPMTEQYNQNQFNNQQQFNQPQKTQQRTSDPFPNNNEQPVINDDDLPF